MKTATAEIRALVVNAHAAGITSLQTLAEIFGYHINSIKNWIRVYKREGRVAPNPKGHRKSVFTPEDREELAGLLRKHPDMTLAEIKTHFQKNCSLAAIQKIVVSLGFVFKKNSEGKRARST